MVGSFGDPDAGGVAPLVGLNGPVSEFGAVDAVGDGASAPVSDFSEPLVRKKTGERATSTAFP
jgi:hypothetical protein